MKASAIAIALIGFATTATAAPQVPICTFDPVKGEYVCPGKTALQVPTTTSAKLDPTLIDVAIAKCGQEGLRKCTRERQGSECRNGKWEIIHRCATDQQCDMKDNNLCCRTRGPGFSY
ncbi:hypothetical protein N0V94_003641 [Neodidymelliopsis sp. IMI 364377]|nr:hypothetical protein N0V94_003641 [Neodidymelliopsis sp. IMI 364377]